MKIKRKTKQKVIHMGKSALNQQSKDSSKTELSTSVPALVSEPSFSGGELGQLQEILYGAQQRSTNQQILTLQTQINEQIQTLGNMLNSRINQLTESVEQTAKANLEKFDQLQTDQNNHAKVLSSSIEENNSQLKNRINLLDKRSDEETTQMYAQIKTVDAQLQSQLRETQDSLSVKINASLDQLQSNKLDKQNLAQMLSEVSDRIISNDPTASK